MAKRAPTTKLEKNESDQITLLIAFYTFAFRLIALPFSNHSSWRTIDQQVRSLHDPLDTTDESSLWQGPTQAITSNAARKLYRATTDHSRGKSGDGDSSPVSKKSEDSSPSPKVVEPDEKVPNEKGEEETDLMMV